MLSGQRGSASKEKWKWQFVSVPKHYKSRENRWLYCILTLAIQPTQVNNCMRAQSPGPVADQLADYPTKNTQKASLTTFNSTQTVKTKRKCIVSSQKCCQKVWKRPKKSEKTRHPSGPPRCFGYICWTRDPTEHLSTDLQSLLHLLSY